jgi:glycosyltransferase involved in cell wall biosynthesis
MTERTPLADRRDIDAGSLYAGTCKVTDSRPRMIFVVEGFTDIRFLSVLAEVSNLTVLAPRVKCRQSGLYERLCELGLPATLIELEGDRLQYQAASAAYLWRHAKKFDLILGQEMLRGALSASVVGRLRKVPVVTYMCLPPVEYFRCRRLRRQVNWVTAAFGEAAIRTLMTVNGRMAHGCITLGPYLKALAEKYSKHVKDGCYYGVDTDLYVPCRNAAEKRAIRAKLNLPHDKFLIFFSSRVSHEKDPETVLKAASAARERGLSCAVLNLGGGHDKFLQLARSLGLPDTAEWVIARPAAHPMRDLPDFYRASDCLAQGSLEEGLGMSPLEALACGTPAVCTDVGGLKANLKGYAHLVPKQDFEAMAQEFEWISEHQAMAREQALLGRRYVEAHWSKKIAAQSLREALESFVRHRDDLV